MVEALASGGIDYAVCGGIAVTLHGAVRSTRDIDLLVREEDLSRALAAIAPLGFDYLALPMVFDAGTAEERRVQRVTKLGADEPLTLDLVLVTPVFADVFSGRQRYTWGATPLWSVSRAGLARMKRLAGRHQDLADLEKLGLDRDEDEG